MIGVNIELVGAAAAVLQVSCNAHTQLLVDVLAESHIANIVLVSTHHHATLQCF